MTYGFGYTWLTRTTGFISRTLLHFRRTELDYMMEFVKKMANPKVLDYGCNTGYYLKMLKEAAPQGTYYGADINVHAINSARAKYPDFRYYDLNTDVIEEKFDVIILAHVLEHVKEPQVLINKLVSYLNKGGYLMVAVPQERIRGDASIFQIAYNFLRFRFVNPHVVKINYDQLNEYCKNEGLRITEKTYTNYLYPFRSEKRRLDAWSLVAVAKYE